MIEMKILIIGSCRNHDEEHRKKAHKKLAEEIGKGLALRGHEIITGGAGGLQGILVHAYKKNKGKKWTVYYAKNEEKEKNAKPLEKTEPDKEFKTKYNYSMRDAFYIGKSEAVIALSGKALTLAEIIHAAKNYKLKIFQLAIGKNIKIIPKYKELREKTLITRDIKKGIDFLE